MPRRQFFDALEKGTIGVIRQTANQKIADQIVLRDNALHEWQKLANLGAEREFRRRIDIIERLYAKTIPRAEQRVVPFIVNGERPHAIEALETFFSPAAHRRPAELRYPRKS